jgi:hypothetical protein
MSRHIAIAIVVVSTLSWFGAAVLMDLSEWSNQLAKATLVAALAGTIFSLVQLLQGRRVLAAVCLTPLLVVYFTYFSQDLIERISVIGFRAAVNMQTDYRSRCQLVRIPSDGPEGVVGVCNVIPQWGGSTKIIYDSSGQFVLDPEKRSRDWKWKVRDLPSGKFLADSSTNRRHLFGEYYEVFVPETAEEG